MAVQNLTVNFDGLDNVMLIGIRRASSFMFLGLKSAKDDTITSVRLDGFASFQWLPEPLPEVLAKEICETFGTWVIGSGFRELDAHFSRMLDEAYQIYTLLDLGQGKTVAEFQERMKPFEHKTNSGAKMEEVMKAFGSQASLFNHIRSLSQARNALTHNMGVVGEKHLTGPNELKVQWRALGIHLNGKPMVPPDDGSGIPANQGDRIEVVALDREKGFQLGEIVVFTPHELHEICLTYWIQADEIKRKAIDYARTKGMNVTIIEHPPIQNS